MGTNSANQVFLGLAKRTNKSVRHCESVCEQKITNNFDEGIGMLTELNFVVSVEKETEFMLNPELACYQP